MNTNRTNTNRPTPHCENCGRENPGTDEGYTGCCNENVCHGDASYAFGTRAKHAYACCWAKATKDHGITEGSRARRAADLH